MKKLTRKSLDELAKTLPVIEEASQMHYVGGGDGTSANPYTQYEYNTMLNSNSWNGGYVEGIGYVANDVYIHGNSTYPGQTSQVYYMNLSDFIRNQSISEADIWANTGLSIIPGLSQMIDQFGTRLENMMRELQATLLDQGYTNSEAFTVVKTDLSGQNAIRFSIYNANNGSFITSRTIHTPYGNWN
ncbi:hypothetical protein TFKS16_1509 [Tannerella forsythia KS16]|jgi:hypothetical protein|uniref:Uncharacterized protein n=1 Tax=Tannerella forsythia TaxID=28112 RepID=A0A1D3UNN1_TANFO|nr:hypothetical protein [Tannerella forsythia]KKY61923.1 hypothetical protein Tanf_03585 [Tannerella forsythia]OLQ20617.1 hypothetical protein BGK60_06625 [Tannerella forsythia]PDP45191.1 hypothetical protein CLI86_00760 [Tannerella forsythia]TPE15338.1 hypothetical protein FJN16_11935 [Tannerella forsythia]SCQ20851.1 hypothetical protein TFUB4_01417 [Tannerella forsythia]